MSAKESYELFKKFNTQFEGIKKNKKFIEDVNKDKILYEFLKDLKDVLYHTIYKELEPYKHIDNNEKLIRCYVKYIIQNVLPICNYKIDYYQKNKIENNDKIEKIKNWIDLEDDFYAMAAFRSLKHFAYYIERGNSDNKIWKKTMPVFESYFYYANAMILEDSCDLIRASYFPGAGKTYAGNLTCCWWFGIEETSILRITYSENLYKSFTKQIVSIIETPQYKKVFPKFNLPKKDLYRTCNAGELWFSFYNKASFYATTRDGQATGKRARVLMIDDVTKGAEEAFALDVHNHIIDQYDNNWRSRADDSNQKQILLGTMWSPYDLLNHVQKTAEKFSPLRKDEHFKYTTKTADGLNVFIGVPMLDYDTDMSTCEERYKTEEMRKKRASFRNKALWNAVYQQQPEAPEELIFDHKNLYHYEDKTFPKQILDGDYECRAMIDPTRTGYDYFAMGIFKRYMIDKENEIWSKWYLVDCVFRRDIYKNLKSKVLDKIIRHRVSKLTIEINTSNELADLIEEDLADLNYKDIEIEPIFSTEKKEEKISRARVGIIEEVVYPSQFMFDEMSEMGSLMVQFTTYDVTVRNNKHDDSPDMIAMFIIYNCESEVENTLEVLPSEFRLI